jgi:glycosyltransferase involved in cell wall biosynthesis
MIQSYNITHSGTGQHRVKPGGYPKVSSTSKQIKGVRLMQVVPDLGLGGLQQVVVNLCRKIDTTKFNVSVLCLNELGPFAREIENLGIEVLLLPQIRGNDYLAFWKVARVFRDKKVQVVHTHNTQPFLDSVMASFFSKVGHIVHTDHARNFPDKKRYMAAEWIASHFVNYIVGVSYHTSWNLHRYVKIPLKKIKTIPNGIDESVYNFSIDKDKLKKKLGIPKNGPVIGIGVRLSEQKGITYLLKAMPIIISQNHEVSLVIAGDGPLRKSLEEEASELGIQKHVYFIGLREDMPRILKMLDLYVLPSIWEGLPMVILEALSAGIPIIATDVGGNSDVIKHRFNGSLVPSRDPSILGTEINHLLSEPGLRRAYAENGLHVFNSKYSAAIMTRRYESLYLKRN